MTKRFDNERILFLSDTHFPYHHKDTIPFLHDIRDYYKPDRVIHGGDLLDCYSISDFPKSVDHKDSWSSEIKKGRQLIKELSNLFPNLTLLSSNHDDRAYKKSRVSGVPREFLIPYMDMIGAPEGWRLQKELHITIDSTRDKWVFAHTLNGGSFVAAKHLGKSVCIGHHHTKFAMNAFKGHKRTIWGVDGGCLISDAGAPYSYNKTNVNKPIQGCVIIEGGKPSLIKL